MSIFYFVRFRKNDDYKEINIPAGKTYEVYLQDLWNWLTGLSFLLLCHVYPQVMGMTIVVNRG